MKCERTRRTQPAIKVRPFPEERAVLEECAAAARMPLAGFLLAAGLGTTVKSVVDLQHVATLAKAHADMGRLFAQAEHEHLIMFLMLAVGTAARPNATLSLTDAQIDTRRGIIPLQPVGVARTKKRNPTLPIPQPLRAVLHGLPPGPVVSYFGRHVQDIGRALSGLPGKQQGPRRCRRGPCFIWWSQ